MARLRLLWLSLAVLSGLADSALGYTPGVPLIGDNNLSDVQNAATARTNLGLGAASAVTMSSLALSGATLGASFLAGGSLGSFGSSGAYTPGSAAAMITTVGASNGLIGQVVNNVPYSTNPFLPVGVTGYGQVPSGTASVAYGLYGLGELRNAFGVVTGGEVTARNFSGANASNAVPPPTGTPSSAAVANGWQVTCGSQEPLVKDCSTGIWVSTEGGGTTSTDASFANGMIINGYRQYGLYIMQGYSTGNQVTAELDNNGNSTNLVLKTTQTQIATNSVLAIYDHTGTLQGGLFQNGDGHFNNILSVSETINGATYRGAGTVSITGPYYSTNAVPMVAPNVTTGTPVASACWDTNGSLIKKTTTGPCI